MAVMGPALLSVGGVAWVFEVIEVGPYSPSDFFRISKVNHGRAEDRDFTN